MSRYRFSAAERWGVFTAHGAKCYLCGEPIDLLTMEVDHVLPEALLDKPEELAQALRAYDLPEDFDLNTYSNWLPACRPCNGTKSGRPLRVAPITLTQIDKARAKSSKAASIAEEVQSDLKISRALNAIERAFDRGQIDDECVKPLIAKFVEKNPEILRAVKPSTEEDEDIGPVASPQELRIAPFYKVLLEKEGWKVVRTPLGVGYVPADAGQYCRSCGSLGPWNGTRCLSCGSQDDGD